METFRDDDGGYRAWIYANPSGRVVNAERNPKPGNLILHTAMCDTITPATDRPCTTGDYFKICALKRYELDEWARSLGGRLTECTFCGP